MQDSAATQSTASSLSVAVNVNRSACTGAGDDCILSIVPVHVKKGSRVVETYVFMEPGSSTTFCTDTLS